jgi:hypothetical protein
MATRYAAEMRRLFFFAFQLSRPQITSSATAPKHPCKLRMSLPSTIVAFGLTKPDLVKERRGVAAMVLGSLENFTMFTNATAKLIEFFQSAF